MGGRLKNIYVLLERVAFAFLDFLDLRDLRVLLFFAPPFKGIVVGAPMPPDQLHQT